MVVGRSNIETAFAMRVPATSIFGSFVEDDTRAKRSKGISVEVVRPAEVCCGGECWIHSCGAEKIECQLRLIQEAVPKMKRERRVTSAEDGDEVVLKGANGTLCCITPVHGRRCELKIDCKVGEQSLKFTGCLVV